MEMAGDISKKHIVLVHGVCHGAWCWYKVSSLLRKAAGCQVTTLDLSASGINPKPIHEVTTFEDYTRPLLDLLGSLPSGERVILVGHSLGGLNIALAMDRFPEKIAAGVFVTAFMPDSTSPPSTVINELQITPSGWMDTQSEFDDGPEQPPTTLLFGPKFTATRLYQLCPPEDLELARTLMRVGSLFQRDLSSKPLFSQERYGSVDRVYVVCRQDKGIVEEYQLRMISNYPPMEVKVIEEADHMAMLSAPGKLCRCLLEIAETYA